MIANNSIYNVPGAVQRALHILTYLNLQQPSKLAPALSTPVLQMRNLKPRPSNAATAAQSHTAEL